MPLYDYQCANPGCDKHGKPLEYLVPTSGGTPKECDYCHKPTLERAQSLPKFSIGRSSTGIFSWGDCPIVKSIEAFLEATKVGKGKLYSPDGTCAEATLHQIKIRLPRED